MNIVQLTWKQTIPVRHEVLWPGMPEDFCFVVGDENAKHYGVEVDGELVAVASVFIDEDEGSARLRKFATLIEHRHMGLGTALISYIIEDIQQYEVNYFWCIARESTVEFYEKFKLAIESDRFSRCGVNFFRMGRRLSQVVTDEKAVGEGNIVAPGE